MALTPRLAASVGAVYLLGAGVAGAQTIPRLPDPSAVKFRLGPLYLDPSFALTNLGVDTNVFYVPEVQNPEKDFTIAATAQSDYWLRMGRTWVAGTVKEDLVWYQKFTGERTANQNHTAYWLVPLNRLSVTVGGNWIRARERPGFEIDARSRRQELAGGAVVEIRALSRTFIGVRGERRKVDFDETAVFLGSSLQHELNRVLTTGAVTIRNELTSLTSVSLEVARGQDRFEFSPIRDTDSTSVKVGVSFEPLALINGSAQIGYRRFTTLDREVPGYTGSTASVNLGYVARGATRFGLQALRDIQYSFELERPYYLQTGFNATVAQQIYGPIDVEIHGGRHALAYRNRGVEADRVDHVRFFGGGVGYRVDPALRIGFSVDRQRRTSDILQRNYEGLRYGLAVNYGL